MTINGKDNSVKFYGASPMIGNVYRVFIPSGNMSMAFIITTSGEVTSAVTSVNGQTGNVNLTANGIGAAPAGYGLGGGSKKLTADDDLNNIWQNGWYCWDASPSNAPSGDGTVGDYGSYKMMLVINHGSDYVFTQIVFNWKGSILVRQKVADSIGEWEWLNPAMSLGVEYRTTERYNGKPVYAKLVDCGSVASGQKIIDYDSTGNCRPFMTVGTIGLSSAVGYGGLSFIANTNSIVVNAQSGSEVIGSQLNVLVKYTKATD